MKYYLNLILSIFLLLIITNNLNAQSAHKSLRNGDMLYGFGKYQDAETEYRRAESQKSSVKSSYNLGNALIQQERYDEASKKYEEAAAKATNDTERSDIYYNQGNALYKKQQYQESINAYKKSLKYNPNDIATKENLALARQQLRQQQQQQQQEKNKHNKQNKDQNKDNSDQNQQNKDQNANDKQDKKEQDQQQDKDKQNDNQDSQNEKPEGKEMSRSDAQKLLEIMDNEEKKVQQKMRRVDGKGKKVKKDW
jgi:Ca-activated chloride channel homolog